MYGAAAVRLPVRRGSHSAASAYDALREQFDALRDGDLRADNEDLSRQIRSGQDQIVDLCRRGNGF